MGRKHARAHPVGDTVTRNAHRTLRVHAPTPEKDCTSIRMTRKQEQLFRQDGGAIWPGMAVKTENAPDEDEERSLANRGGSA